MLAGHRRPHQRRVPTAIGPFAKQGESASVATSGSFVRQAPSERTRREERLRPTALMRMPWRAQEFASLTVIDASTVRAKPATASWRAFCG